MGPTMPTNALPIKQSTSYINSPSGFYKYLRSFAPLALGNYVCHLDIVLGKFVLSETDPKQKPSECAL